MTALILFTVGGIGFFSMALLDVQNLIGML